MRILVVTNLYPPLVRGGYEIACANTVAGLRAQGHDVRVLTSWNHLSRVAENEIVRRDFDLHWFFPGESSNAVVTERALHAATASSLSNTYTLLRHVEQFEPDVVYVWNTLGLGGAAIFSLLDLLGIPWVLHLMDNTPATLVHNNSQQILSIFAANPAPSFRPRTTIVMSESLKQEMWEAWPGSVANCVIVPGFVRAVAADRPRVSYQRDGLTRFVAAGTVSEHKGMSLMLEAASRLLEEKLSFTVDVFGEGDIGHFADLSRSLDLDQIVTFRGPIGQEDLLASYREFDAFLFPTWEREPFGLAPLEAAAHGTPPVITAQCGVAEWLVDGVHCLKISRDVGSLTNAMRRIILGQVNLSELGAAGANLVAADLSFEKYMLDVEAILVGACEERLPPVVSPSELPLLLFGQHALALRIRFG